MYMNNTEPVEIDEYRLELENRIRNLLWTVSGDYQLDMKPDVSLFLRSKAIALYDGIKQGALARYYDKDMLGLYLVKKIFLQAGETEDFSISPLGLPVGSMPNAKRHGNLAHALAKIAILIAQIYF